MIGAGNPYMTVHTFEPTRFLLTLGSHEPVLRISDGDTVRTWCVMPPGMIATTNQ
jgi:hypothetical protein